MEGGEGERDRERRSGKRSGKWGVEKFWERREENGGMG
jgi:hypothetical protein